MLVLSGNSKANKIYAEAMFPYIHRSCRIIFIRAYSTYKNQLITCGISVYSSHPHAAPCAYGAAYEAPNDEQYIRAFILCQNTGLYVLPRAAKAAFAI